MDESTRKQFLELGQSGKAVGVGGVVGVVVVVVVVVVVLWVVVLSFVSHALSFFLFRR